MRERGAPTRGRAHRPTRTHARTRARAETHAQIRTQTHTHPHTHTHTHTHTQTSTPTHPPTHLTRVYARARTLVMSADTSFADGVALPPRTSRRYAATCFMFCARGPTHSVTSPAMRDSHAQHSHAQTRGRTQSAARGHKVSRRDVAAHARARVTRRTRAVEAPQPRRPVRAARREHHGSRRAHTGTRARRRRTHARAPRQTKCTHHTHARNARTARARGRSQRCGGPTTPARPPAPSRNRDQPRTTCAGATHHSQCGGEVCASFNPVGRASS